MTWTETILSFVSPELFSLVFLLVAFGCGALILDSKKGLR
jgi:hypothetical protein